MNVRDFIPNYPNKDDPDLQQKIMNKTEFAEIDVTNRKSVNKKYYDFQVNIANILSPVTPYNRVLLDLKVGVGKCVHPLTLVKLSNGHSTTIESLWKTYNGEFIDENWSYPSQDIHVLSYDGSFCTKRITKLYREHKPKTMVKINTSSGVLIKTQMHRVMIRDGDDEKWENNLVVGDQILTEKGLWDTVQSVEKYDGDFEYVYDLEIEDTHTYVADGFVTHNTCSAILAHEISKLYYGGGFRKTVVMAKGPSLLENWKAKFLDVCPGARNEIIEDLEPGLTQKEINERLKEETKANFIFKTVGAFMSVLAKMSDQQIREQYSNRIFVLDESQVLKNYKSPAYKQFSRLTTLTDNSVFIFMTGTPNINLPWEGVAQINLLKDEEDRIEVGPKFITRYYKDGELRNEEELLEFYHGYIIHVRQTTDLPEREFVTNPDHPTDYLEETDVYRLEMSDFQSKIYKKSLTDVQSTFLKEKKKNTGRRFNIQEFKFRVVKDEDGNPVMGDDGKPKLEKIEYTSEAGGAFLRLVLESSLFVYPDGTYGGKGYKKNVLRDKNVVIPPQMIELFRKDLGKYSAIYKKIFDILRDPENSSRVVYIYFDNLNNSGLKLFAKLLEVLDGYTRTRGLSACSKRKRYAVIDGSMKEAEISRVLKTVGMKDNADGSCVKVLLGSEVTQTGLTIPHATIGIVVNAQFTPSSTEQITKRINRPGSLDDVIEAGLPTDTKIYLMAPFAKNDPEESAYMQVYKIAEDKMKMIRPQEELMKRSGLFCPVNYQRNVRDEDENYACYSAEPSNEDGIFEYERTKDDHKTDRLYFQMSVVDELVEKILDDIQNEGIVDIQRYIGEYPKMIVYRAGKRIASQKVVLKSGEYKSLVYNDGDLFFLDPSISSDPNSSFYFKTKFFSTGTSLKQIMTNESFNNDVELVEEMLGMDDENSMRKIFTKLSKATQNTVFEDAYFNKDESETLEIISKFKPVYDIDGDIYNVVWAEPTGKDSQYGGGTVAIDDPSKIRILKEQGWAWVPPKTEDSTGYEDIVPRIKGSAKTKLKKIEIDGDFYATKSKSDGIFKIFMKGGRPGGRACSNFSGKIYMQIYKRLGLFEKLYGDKIKEFKKKHKGNVEGDLMKLLKTTKAKALSEDFTLNDKIGAYFALEKKDDEKCRILEKEFKEQDLFYLLE